VGELAGAHTASQKTFLAARPMFWSSQTLKNRLTELVSATDPKAIKQGSVELRLGHQATISGDGVPRVTELSEGQALNIPPGQFGLLLTEEIVTLPHNVLAFISLKTGVKSRGLMNVSGFHVDPGFEGRLKFWVYNAGNQEIIIRRGDPTFLIWFGDFDEKVSDPYPNRDPAGQRVITSEDLNKMQGKLCSPMVLQAEVRKLHESYQTLLTLNWTLLATTLGLFLTIVGVVLAQIFADPKPTEVKIQVSDPGRLLISPSNAAPPPVIFRPMAAPVQPPAKDDGKTP
jgi:dCTP deaminase